ncbi:TPA: hypothetical protein RNS99_000525 [Stenotrophomonas maltophilia]|uniref:hypothetical protein n=1 Tax=Stenotrophomonas maltophilia TaxID=40324 RepID=UPI000AD30051|nr:hypothetical protein [Stenotrophomonas maltophilia]MDH2061572.1 hypothetical protein [Stenotrophomonas maltophilia]HDX0898647.1 hypothetical protein [Stenotrophomonas maltophilia]HDX0916314.1 hypothetical protein [Stenotrophomonas maltophilia]HEL3010239.1 hypothetical protein [Stenotrophomonas maltophilia]HEL4138129.1 hypothetical protein [Stenotrophomonas maltophilia]
MSVKDLPIFVDSANVLQRMSRRLQRQVPSLGASVQDFDEPAITNVSVAVDRLYDSIEVPGIVSTLMCSGSQLEANSFSTAKQSLCLCEPSLARLLQARNRAEAMTEEDCPRIGVIGNHHMNGPASLPSMKLDSGDFSIRFQRKHIPTLLSGCIHSYRPPFASVARLYHPTQINCASGGLEGSSHG